MNHFAEKYEGYPNFRKEYIGDHTIYTLTWNGIDYAIKIHVESKIGNKLIWGCSEPIPISIIAKYKDPMIYM